MAYALAPAQDDIAVFLPKTNSSFELSQGGSFGLT
jgi:hypothetical protein